MRTLSPSNCCTTLPYLSTRASSSALAMVDLPLPDSPVIHNVMPFCWMASEPPLFHGRWQASWDSPALASAHSMMFGEVWLLGGSVRADVELAT